MADKLSDILRDQDVICRVSKHSEVCRIQRAIENTITNILTRVAGIDDRLKLSLKKVGSYYDGLKIGLPDEFDFLAELQTFKEDETFAIQPTGFNGTHNLWRTPDGQPGRRKVQIINSEFEFTCRNGALDSDWLSNVRTKRKPEYVVDCIEVKNSFFDAVLNVVKKLKEEDLPRYLHIGQEPTYMHGPAVTLEFIWNGRTYKNLKISVDLTICIKVKKWQRCIDVSYWKDSCIGKQLEAILNKDGYHLTPYISDYGKSCQWRVSTSHTEHLLMDTLPYDSKLKVAIRNIKNQRDLHICKLPSLMQMEDKQCANFHAFIRFYEGEDENKQLVTSYLIKTTALETIGFLSKREFERVQTSVLYIYMLCRLFRLIQIDNVRMFFISEYKLRIPSLGDVIPGFKAVFDSINPDDVPKTTPFKRQAVLESSVGEGEMQSVRYIFKRMKDEIDFHYLCLWDSTSDAFE